MKIDFAKWGNQLHSGEKSYRIVQNRKRFFLSSVILGLICIGLLIKPGLHFGIDFTGGTEFRVSGVSDTSTMPAHDVVAAHNSGEEVRITVVGGNDIRVQMGVVPAEEAQTIANELASAYGLPSGEESVSYTSIGPTWGKAVGQQAIKGAIIFLLLVSVVITIYFRSWRMASGALVALFHDLLFTAGIYALVGFEVTPATVIGFLTILGYSLYDTVVVFDKVRENTKNVLKQDRYTHAELANLAINQTLVRSINTSVVALLPVGAILFGGIAFAGAGTLRDIALALFVGMAVGAYSSIFIATPVEVALRERDEQYKAHTAKVLQARADGTAPSVVLEDGSVRVGALVPGGHKGVAAQPKRKRRS